jgi:hypothetical protein
MKLQISIYNFTKYKEVHLKYNTLLCHLGKIALMEDDKEHDHEFWKHEKTEHIKQLKELTRQLLDFEERHPEAK